MSLMVSILSQDRSSCSDTWWKPVNRYYPPPHPWGSQSCDSLWWINITDSTDTTSCVLTHHNWMFDRLLVASSSPSDRAMFAMVGQHRMGNRTFAPCCYKSSHFLKVFLKILCQSEGGPVEGREWAGLDVNCLLCKHFPDPDVYSHQPWESCGVMRVSINMQSNHPTCHKQISKPRKFCRSFFPGTIYGVKTFEIFAGFDTFKSHVIITCRIKCKRLVAIRASCGHTCVL